MKSDRWDTVRAVNTPAHVPTCRELLWPTPFRTGR
jgi:hypothetical protein